MSYYFLTLDKNKSPGIADSENPKTLLIRKILNQTWEIVDSPIFAASVKEVADSYFHIFFDQLKRSTFIKDAKVDLNTTVNVNVNNMKKPPLAALLTRIQSISTNMIPIEKKIDSISSSGGGGVAKMSQNQSNFLILREIMSGPILDSLCISVFDASTLND